MGEESMGLKKLLAGDFSQNVSKKYDAGLTEETDKMIQEEVRNCR